MRRRVVFLFALVFTTSSFAQSVGGGVSVFIPKPIFDGFDGSVVVETAFETSFGIGDGLSLPIGLVYNQNFGLFPLGKGFTWTERPWFFSDSFLTYTGLKMHVPIDMFYLDLFGGGALNFNTSMRPIMNQIESDKKPDGVDAIKIKKFEKLDVGIGYGWLAGAGFGITIDKISIDLNATWRWITHPISATVDYWEINGSTATLQNDVKWDAHELILAGLSAGISGSFSLE